MPATAPTAPDAIAEPELAHGGSVSEGTQSEVKSQSTASDVAPKKRSAFAELMDVSKRSKPEPATAKDTKSASSHGGRHLNQLSGRNGLGAYISDPDQFSSREIIYATPSFVAIRDAYPKASVHALLLPRDSDKSLQHPFEAFEDVEFLNSVKAEVPKLKKIVASELRHRYGKFSAAERPRIEAMETDPPPAELPAGRDWEAEVMVGIHAGPSMNHLHVHVLSVDHVSEWMKHRRHYTSFKTPFFVKLDEFPLAPDDPRRKSDRGGHLHDDLACWRCGRNFGNKFAQLKPHLGEELEAWKRE